MKRLFSALLVIALMLTMAVPCFAASEENTRTTTGVTYDSTSGTGYDPAGNRFRMTGYASLSGKRVIVHTEFEILNYGAGVTSSLDDTTQVVGTRESLVVFSDGTTSNNFSLNGSNPYYSSPGNVFHKDQTFTGIVSSVDCKHYLRAYAYDDDGNWRYTDISGSTNLWVT